MDELYCYAGPIEHIKRVLLLSFISTCRVDVQSFHISYHIVTRPFNDATQFREHVNKTDKEETATDSFKFLRRMGREKLRQRSEQYVPTVFTSGYLYIRILDCFLRFSSIS
jgi:hypothetical protein